MRKQYVVRLAEQERALLLTMVGRGVAPARAQAHARILLKANRGEAAVIVRCVARSVIVQPHGPGRRTRPWSNLPLVHRRR